MIKLNNNNLKLAIQKQGRLTAESIKFLGAAGLEFDSYQKRLFSKCWNFPLEIIFVRDDDIPNYVQTGTVDLGIVGKNLIYEKRAKVNELLPLGFGSCSLVVAVPKDANIVSINQLKNKKIATNYPQSTREFFAKEKIPIKIVKVSGAVEVTPLLGLAEVIVDLTATGKTLALNGLRRIKTIYDSQAVLIANEKALRNKRKVKKINLLLAKIKEVSSD